MMPRRPKDGWSTPLKVARCIVLCVVYSKVKLERESIGICNWKKALEKIKNHYKSIQHKSAESACAQFLQRYKHIDVMLDSS